MTLRNNQQLVANFITLNTTYSNLYQLKFKGKKLLQQLINACWQKELMIKSIKDSFNYRETMIYTSAINNCTEFVTARLSEVEEEVIKKYIGNVEVARRNKEYVEKIKNEYMGVVKEITDQYELLLLELVQLSITLAQQYERQLQLILKFWQTITSQYFQNSKEPTQLKELMLHLSFQTQIDYHTQQTWKTKILALSNQRYNPKKS